ncbi:MAG TPA: hypothetical protein VLA74_02435 [Nitrososphaeraceae archaeon]|nr:hypothetical protein [Nitrososphaeraceae archaeon]
MEDLINNHYPRIKTAWEETWNFYNEKVINHQDLRDHFHKIFEETFKQNNLDINEFKIWRIIEYFLLKREYKENNLSIFTYHSYSHVINLGEWSHKKIYESENLDTINSVKNILDQIFKKIIQLEDVKEKLKMKLKC